MQEKAITIPFNYDQFIESRKTLWQYSIKKVIKSDMIYTIISIAILIFELKYETKDIVGIIIGSTLCLYMLLRWINLYERRQKFFKITSNCAKRFMEVSMECSFTLSEHEIAYKDKAKLYKLNWSVFNPYVIFKNTILLTDSYTGGIVFTISKSEVGDENYAEICDILKDKIGVN